MCSIVHNNVSEFRGAVTAESGRLSSLCSTWRTVIEEDAARPNKELTEDIVGDINVAIGQAELLKRQRFHQFHGLIDNCEFKTGEKETTVQDLQGFWDIIYFQVDDISKKFEALDRLRTSNWQKQQPQRPVVPKRPVLVKKAVAAVPHPTAAASSSIRAHILAARNKLNKLALENSSSAPQQLNTVPCAVLQNPSNTAITVTRSTPMKSRPALRDKENIDTSGHTTRNKGSTPATVASTACSTKNLVAADDNHEALQASDDTTVNTSPQLSTFDAGFFKIQTPCKTKMGRREKVIHKTPDRSRSAHGETLVLASSLLKERVQRTPVVHKDYSPCMRITRSMKKRPQRVSPDHSPL